VYKTINNYLTCCENNVIIIKWRGGEKEILKYINKYYIYTPIDLKTLRPTKNINDSYLSGISETEIYRESDNIISIYMPKGKSTSNTIIPKLEALGVTLKPKLLCDEEVWTFPEEVIHIVHKVLKFKINGKNEQMISPKDGRITTKEKVKKMLDRIAELESKKKK